MAPETSEQAAVREITPQEAFDELKSSDAILVDTREPHEYSEAHIDGANLVPPAMLAEKIANVAPTSPAACSCPAAPASAPTRLPSR